ncbi:oligosaccharide flippase family protein [uncultured Christiangramia sp.]|uniref:oligosaccharide flippase family protein n=1 Tax=Christiangramia sp. 3-2217-3z TaxID=3417564 RepID=UPI00261D5A3F|nr:oligosaccharide flippase family protein [uncultured Christiangramia sp.]
MLKKLKRILNRESHQILLSNFFSLSAIQVVGMVLPLITLPYILRVVGFDKYGVIVLAASLIAYFQSVTDFSFKITATRDVAKFKDSPQKLNIIYSRVLTVKFILLFVSLVIITSVVYLYPPFWNERAVFLLTMPLLFGYALFPEWFFQGIEKMKYISFLDIGIKIFFTICIFIFINKKEDYWIYPLLQSSGYIGAGIIGQIILAKKYKLKFYWLKGSRIRSTLKQNYPIFINQFVPTLYNNTTTFLLGTIGSSSAVGIYAAIKKIVDLAVKLLNIVSRVFFPFLNRNHNAFSSYRRLFLYSTFALCFLIIVLSPVIFWYLNIDNPKNIWILVILVIGVIGYAFYDVYGLNYFIVHQKDKLVMNSTILASLIGLIFAGPLISYFSIIGAALNLTISRTSMGGILFFHYKRLKK